MKQYLNKIYTGSVSSFYELAKQKLLGGGKSFIITANPEILMQANKNPEIKSMLLSDENLIVPDGISVVKAMRNAGIAAKERIAGVDICEYLLRTAGEHRLSVYLLGAKEEVVSALSSKITAQYPEMQVHYSNGYDRDKDQIFSEIKELSPDLVIVGLGVPAQELLINRHYQDFTHGVFIGVGGSFDVLSGMKKRSPAIFIKTNTEWLYRILREPSRIKRFWNSNVKFMRYMKKSKK